MSNKVPQIRFNGYSDAWVQREFVKMVDRVSESSTAELPRVEFEDLISGMGRLNKDVTKPGDTRSGIHFVAGDVLYGKLRPYLNNWLHASFEGLALGDFWVFRTKEMLESSFLYALIQAPKYQQAANLSSGTKMPRSDWKTVSTTEFCVPEKQEQQKIGELFNNLDKLIAANQRKLDLLKEQKKGYLQKMFPKNGAKVPGLRFAGFADDWEERKLGELSNIVGGGTPSTSNPEYWDGDIDWYAPAEIGEQSYVSKSKKTITELGLKKSSARILPVGTVLFTSRAGIGNTAILAKEATTNQGFQSIVPDQNKLDSYFIFSRTNELKRYGEVTGAGSTFVEVSGKQMSKMPIMVPELSEQKKIGSFFKQLDATIALHQRKLDLLKEQKKGLLQKMFI